MATYTTGLETTYTGALQLVRELADVVLRLSPEQTPLLTRIGLDSYPDGPVTNTKYEWLEDELLATSSAIDEDLDTSETAVDVENAKLHQVGDVILVGNEIMWVTAVDVTNNTLHVVRGYAGTTAATHSDGDPYYILGNARVEGSSPGFARQVSMTVPYNYTQIFDEVVEVSGTEEAVRHYGVDDVLDYRVEKRLLELKMKMERALMYARRHAPADNTAARVSGGLAQFITDKDDWGAGDVLYADMLAALTNAWQRVGNAYAPTLAVLNATQKKSLTAEFVFQGAPATAWYGIQRTERTERVGGGFIEVLETDFGRIDLMLDHLCGTNDVWLINPDLIFATSLRGRTLREYDATIPGEDKTRRRILGEIGWVVKGSDAHVWLYT